MTFVKIDMSDLNREEFDSCGWRTEYKRRYKREYKRRRREMFRADRAANRRSRKDRGRGNRLRAYNLFGGFCHSCGFPHPVTVIDFHHVNSSEKEFEPCKIGYNWEVFWGEVATKCYPVCRNCHSLIHAGVSRIGDYSSVQ